MDNNDQIYSAYENEKVDTDLLTLDRLKSMSINSTISSGVTNNPILHSGPVKWVAKRGVIHDWCIYYHTADKNQLWIENWGDKCTTAEVIRLLVPCTDEAFKMYRY